MSSMQKIPIVILSRIAASTVQVLPFFIKNNKHVLYVHAQLRTGLSTALRNFCLLIWRQSYDVISFQTVIMS
jgi:hypothetical protein